MKPISEQSFVYPRPGPGTKTRRVWEIADEITQYAGRPATRGEVLARYTSESGNGNTASTQYQHWKNWHEQHPDTAATSQTPVCDAEPQSLRLSAEGRLSIPLEMRKAMLLGEDGRVTAHVSAGELRIISPAAAVKQVQSRMKKYKKPGVDMVDEFLRDRRAIWGET